MPKICPFFVNKKAFFDKEKIFFKKVKKSVDKRGGVWYYTLALASEGAQNGP
jgi:hypothetical protein